MILAFCTVQDVFAQIINEQKNFSKQIIWSVYEHIAGIKVNVGDGVSPFNPIARFINTEKLNQLGWKFDHLHLEIMKINSLERKPIKEQLQLLYRTFALTCYTEEELIERYFKPMEFFVNEFKEK